jgi:hypothetical protein
MAASALAELEASLWLCSPLLTAPLHGSFVNTAFFAKRHANLVASQAPAFKLQEDDTHANCRAPAEYTQIPRVLLHTAFCRMHPVRDPHMQRAWTAV